MGFEWQDEGKFHRIPKLEPGPANVYFGMDYCPLQCTSLRIPCLLTILEAMSFRLHRKMTPTP